MTQRERTLAAVAGVFVLGLAGFATVKKMYLDPLAAVTGQAKGLRNEIAKLEREKASLARRARALGDYARRTLPGTAPEVEEQVRSRLVRLMEQAGLSTDHFSSSPVDGGRLQRRADHADRFVGRSITIRGNLDHVTNFLYLLESDPLLHRVDYLTLSPDPRTGKVDLKFQYLTLLLEGRPEGGEAATQPGGDLDTDARRRYDTIAQRDVFRPYRPRPRETARSDPPPPAPSGDGASPPPPPPPPPSDPEDALRVVGLTMMVGEPEVSVRHVHTGETRAYKVGQTLGKGEVVMIDYRPRPLYGNPKELSPSRVILRIGGNYWAVEIGETVANKYVMRSADLPPELREKATAADGKSGGAG